MNDTRTLAERCYDAGLAEDKLFASLHAIMAGAPMDQCRDDNFMWPVVDCWVDPYDSSVEVIVNSGVSPMTREQADAILALGFGQVYESHGDVGRQWTKTGVGKCSPREGDVDDLKRFALRAKLSAAEAKIGELEGRLRDQTQAVV